MAGTHSCSPHHSCLNTPGSFICKSPASTPSAPSSPSDDDLRCLNGSVWNVELRQCELPLMLPLSPSEGPVVVQCPSGTVWNTASMECQMVDCPPGMTVRPETGQCELDSRGTDAQQSSRCPSGFAWSLMSHQCEGFSFSLITARRRRPTCRRRRRGNTGAGKQPLCQLHKYILLILLHVKVHLL